MGMTDRTRKVVSALALATASLFLATCGDATDKLQSAQCSGDFGGGAAGLKVRAILDASVSLATAAKDIENDTLGACKLMARELGLTEGDLTVPSEMAMQPGAETRVVCRKVKAKLDELIGQLNPEVKITVVATPAVCTVNAEFHHKCVETCEQKTITEKELMCKQGRLSGSCSAMCQGSCTGTCMAGCRGSCSATCKGKCEGRISGKCAGTCNGSCDGVCMGKCSAMGADGKCAGTCEGTCMGTCQGSCSAEIEGQCDGRCEGSCSGSCSGSCMGQCSGTCTGSCTAMFQAPYCEEVEVTKMVTECERSCDTRARAEAMCTEPMLSVTVQTNLAAEREKAQRILAAMRVGLPKILKTITRVQGTVQASAKAYAEGFDGLISAVKETGAQAAGCLAAAGQASGRAFGQISASVEVSVEIKASAFARVGS